MRCRSRRRSGGWHGSFIPTATSTPLRPRRSSRRPPRRTRSCAIPTAERPTTATGTRVFAAAATRPTSTASARAGPSSRRSSAGRARSATSSAGAPRLAGRVRGAPARPGARARAPRPPPGRARGGQAGEQGGPPGDLYVVVRVREDSRFVRDGDDLVTVVDVSAPLAALGTTVEVPTVDGTTEIEIPPGTQPHAPLLVRGAGMPALRGRRHGDLRVIVNVVVPRNLDSEQRGLYDQLAGSLTDHNLRSDEGV